MKASAEEFSPPAEPSIRWHGIARSLLLHLFLIAAVLALWRPSAPPETVPPLIKVVFGAPGSAGAAGGSGGETAGQGQATQSDKDAAASGAAAPQQQAEAAPTQQPAATQAQDASATPPAPTESTTPPAPSAVPTPAPLPTAQPSQTAALSPPPPRPQHKPAHTARATAPVTPPQPRPPVATHAPPSSTPEAIATNAAAAPGSGNGAGTRVGQGQGTDGAGHGVIGNGPGEGPGDDYLEKLRRWLAKYKKYPQAALDKKEEGKVIIGFTLKRDGTVLDTWIERSSGLPLLDAAALAMMHNASPVPPIPDHYPGSELKLAMPVDYSIGFFERIFR